jgi:hypothetical protein
MMALAAVTKPGPFAERTAELGEFHGIVERGTLVAWPASGCTPGSCAR